MADFIFYNQYNFYFHENNRYQITEFQVIQDGFYCYSLNNIQKIRHKRELEIKTYARALFEHLKPLALELSLQKLPVLP
jgi:hypothetical protein